MVVVVLVSQNEKSASQRRPRVLLKFVSRVEVDKNAYEVGSKLGQFSKNISIDVMLGSENNFRNIFCYRLSPEKLSPQLKKVIFTFYPSFKFIFSSENSI